MQASPIFSILQWSGTLVTINEPTVTRHYHPEPIVYIRVYSFFFFFFKRHIIFYNSVNWLDSSGVGQLR